MADVQENLPDFLKDLYLAADVKSSNDALVLVLHAFMLEVGFIPKDVPENEELKLLPKNWRDGGVYKIAYYHVTCPELCCLMTCVPVGQLLSIFGTVDDVSEFQGTVTLCWEVGSCIDSYMGFSDPSKVYSRVRKLSQVFKDNIAYALLAAMQDALGFGPTFGLPAAMDVIKLQILSYLPLKNLIVMSSVNKEFHDLCNTPTLWKNLYLRDFSVGLVDSQEVAQVGWKEMYKKRYLEEKRQKIAMHDVAKFSGYLFPDSMPQIRFYPSLKPFPEVSPDIHPAIPEELRTAFPQLQRPTVPNYLIPQPCLPCFPFFRN